MNIEWGSSNKITEDKYKYIKELAILKAEETFGPIDRSNIILGESYIDYMGYELDFLQENLYDPEEKFRMYTCYLKPLDLKKYNKFYDYMVYIVESIENVKILNIFIAMKRHNCSSISLLNKF